MKQLPFWRRPYFARRILDVGPGHNPFRGVTHVLEIDVIQGRERGFNKLVVPDSATLTLGSVEDLPFSDKSFDFVYASHVLEHVASPERACRELMRIGCAGYIETPGPLLEQGLALKGLSPQDYEVHKWFVFTPEKGLLVFEPKTPESVNRFCSCRDGRFIKEFYEAVDFHQAEPLLRRKAKTTMFYWRTPFRVEIRGAVEHCLAGSFGCRYVHLRKALIANCNDLLRAPRLLRFKKTFPASPLVFRKYGHRTLFV